MTKVRARGLVDPAQAPADRSRYRPDGPAAGPVGQAVRHDLDGRPEACREGRVRAAVVRRRDRRIVLVRAPAGRLPRLDLEALPADQTVRPVARRPGLTVEHADSDAGALSVAQRGAEPALGGRQVAIRPADRTSPAGGPARSRQAMTNTTRTASPPRPRAWVRARKRIASAPATMSDRVRAAERDQRRRAARRRRRGRGRAADRAARSSPTPRRSVRAPRSRRCPAPRRRPRDRSSSRGSGCPRGRRLGPSRRSQVSPRKYGSSAGITRWSAARVRGWTSATRLTVRSTANPSSLPAAWSYARRTWMPANATSTRPATASAEPDRNPPSGEQPREQEDGAELGHEVAAGEQNREAGDHDDPDAGQPASSPVGRPDHVEQEDPREPRQGHSNELDRDAGQLAPGAGDVGREEGDPVADQGRRDRRQRQHGDQQRDAAPGPRTDRRRAVGAIDRRLVSATGTDPVAGPDTETKDHHRPCHVQGRARRLAGDRQHRGPDAEEDARQDEPDESRMGDAERSPRDRRPDEDRRRDERAHQRAGEQDAARVHGTPPVSGAPSLPGASRAADALRMASAAPPAGSVADRYA